MSGERPTREFVCDYFHDGSWWSVSIHAYDWEDAEARVKKLGNLRLNGELVLRVTAYPGVETIGKFICWVRNLIFGKP